MKTEIVTVYFGTNSDNNRMCGYTNSPDEFQIFVCLIGAVSFYAVTKIQQYISVCAFYRYCA